MALVAMMRVDGKRLLQGPVGQIKRYLGYTIRDYMSQCSLLSVKRYMRGEQVCTGEGKGRMKDLEGEIPPH